MTNNKNSRNFKEQSAMFDKFYDIVDHLVERESQRGADEGKAITCQQGCDHCCHLLVEASWDEARYMAKWLLKQSEDIQQDILQRLQINAASYIELCLKYKKLRKFAGVLDEDIDELPDLLCDNYFYEKKRPCAFLKDGSCQAYEARPMVCRLHVVNSDPKLCANDQPADVDGYEVPETIEEMQEDITPLNQQLSDDPRWGQLGVMVQTVLKEEYGIDINNILLQHSKNNQVNDVLIAN